MVPECFLVEVAFLSQYSWSGASLAVSGVSLLLSFCSCVVFFAAYLLRAHSCKHSFSNSRKAPRATTEQPYTSSMFWVIVQFWLSVSWTSFNAFLCWFWTGDCNSTRQLNRQNQWPLHWRDCGSPDREGQTVVKLNKQHSWYVGYVIITQFKVFMCSRLKYHNCSNSHMCSLHTAHSHMYICHLQLSPIKSMALLRSQ